MKLPLPRTKRKTACARKRKEKTLTQSGSRITDNILYNKPVLH